MRRVAASILLLVLAAPSQTKPTSSQTLSSAQRSSAERNSRADYIGDEACRSCHADQVDHFHRTAHFLTSRAADATTILGSFAPDANILRTSNPALFFKMEEKPAGEKSTAFFQTAVQGTAPNTTSRSEQFAFVVGSGGKGQTYLYWKDDELFQLPVSYWRVLGWVNSPGYRDGFANFERPIIPRCLECHGTFFQSLAPPLNRYRTDSYALGIQCEKCHGPGRKHADLERSHSPAAASAILNPARFSRERQLELCAWCHAGHGRPLLPTFSYVPGDRLDKYLDLPRPDPDAPLDVHGNQVEMLKRSRCFASSTMTCVTCHDVHLVQHDASEFSQSCLACHKPDSAVFLKAAHPVSNNCIDCHMPLAETNLIVFDSKGTKARPLVRTHWIKVYPPQAGGAVGK